MIANLLIAIAGLFILSLALAPIIGAWLRSRQPVPTCIERVMHAPTLFDWQEQEVKA